LLLIYPKYIILPRPLIHLEQSENIISKKCYNKPVESLIKADIFFFIASIATLVLTVLISLLLYYLIKAGKNLYKLSEALKSEFKESEEFIEDLKERLENNFVFQFFFPPIRRKRKLVKKILQKFES
jgi:di/tricarboxylate transporter